MWQKRRGGHGCSICEHPAVKAINRHIVNGVQYRKLETEYFIGRQSITRHVQNCLKLDMPKLMQANKIERQVDVYNEFAVQLDLMKRLRETAMEYLSDPRDPLSFTFAPRADEIDVLFYRFDMDSETGEVKRTKHVETLAHLLKGVEEGHPGLKIDGFSTKKTDVRALAIELMKLTDRCLTQFAKMEGLYTKERESTETISKGIGAFRYWQEQNPHATPVEIQQAMEVIARGVNVSMKDLEQGLGIRDEVETAVQ